MLEALYNGISSEEKKSTAPEKPAAFVSKAAKVRAAKARVCWRKKAPLKKGRMKR